MWGLSICIPLFFRSIAGAAPIQWALMNGEAETGVTLMLLDAGEDTGDIISADRVRIRDEDTAFTLTEQLAQLGADQLVRCLSDMPNEGPPSAIPQNHAEANPHAPRLTKEDGDTLIGINQRRQFTILSEAQQSGPVLILSFERNFDSRLSAANHSRGHLLRNLGRLK